MSVQGEIAFCTLDAWLEAEGWAGYDPYDIRGQDWYLRWLGGPSFFRRKLRGALTRIEKASPPWTLRRMLGIKKQINAKGIGLIAGAYIARHSSTGDDADLAKATRALDWLSANSCKDYPGVSWGYPFHWHSRILIPRGTPSVVVTGTVGAAFLDHYELTHDPESLETAHGIARFFVEGLNRPVDDERLCFSYTPLDRFRVLNASLFAGAFLARLSAITDNDDYADFACRAARYVIDEQADNGAFPYWGSEPKSVVDHYHTGFVLRHLDTIDHVTGAAFIEEPLVRGYEYYLNHLFTDDGIPMHTPQRKYPIDIHSCAEALLCISQLGRRFGGLERLDTILSFTLKRMRMPSGWFIHQIVKRWGHEQRIEIPYVRWAQAWMLSALARLPAEA